MRNSWLSDNRIRIKWKADRENLLKKAQITKNRDSKSLAGLWWWLWLLWLINKHFPVAAAIYFLPKGIIKYARKNIRKKGARTLLLKVASFTNHSGFKNLTWGQAIFYSPMVSIDNCILFNCYRPTYNDFIKLLCTACQSKALSKHFPPLYLRVWWIRKSARSGSYRRINHLSG